MKIIGQEIVKQWKELLSKKLNRSIEDIEVKGLFAGDFSSSKKVVLSNPGELESTFYNAFSIINEDAGRVAVFTEHSGYHVFYLNGMKVSDISTEEYWDEDYSSY